jgi:type I restriction enzyme R subunit
VPVLEKFTRRNLPHWNVPGAIYFVTTCLEGSIHARGELELMRFRDELDREPCPAGCDDEAWKIRKWKRAFAKREKWLDESPEARHLVDVALAAAVQRSLGHFAGDRYDLLAWVVMPSHYHWVFRPRDEWVASLGREVERRSPRERIQHSVHLYSARECNRLRNGTGSFWQRESYDHCVRDGGELDRIIAYVHANPVKAGIVARVEEYPFSSAYPGNRGMAFDRARV